MLSTAPSSRPIQRSHCILIFSVLLLLRLACAFRFRVDADEPQHLHVIWGWVNGYLPYRDLFDNHGPVFHVLLSPLFSLLGERPDILVPMRLAMIPLFAVCLWCLYRIGTSLFSRNVGICAAVLTGFFPEFFLTSAEFRTDVLWTVCWLLALVIVTGKSFERKQAFLTGFLLGTAFGITVKTGLMIGSLGCWGLLTLVYAWSKGGVAVVRPLVVKALVGLAGFAIVPCLAMLFFVMQGAGQQFLYYNIGFNLVPHTQNWARFDAHVLWFPIFVVILAGIYPFVRHHRLSALGVQRLGLVLATGSYFTALKSFFPTLSRQDDLPVIPLAILIVVSLPFLLADRLSARPKLQALIRWSVPPVVALEIFGITVTTSFWKDDTAAQFAMVADVLKATEKHEFVMDATGETIFRPRPYYYALEAFTKVRIERGLLKDDIARHLIDTQTALVRSRDLTKKAKSFVRDNYLSIGNGLWMVGKKVKPTEPGSRTKIHFETLIAAQYTILSPAAEKVMGELDGMPFTGERILEAGQHDFVAAANIADYLLLFSARGFERGFLPHEATAP